VTVHLAQVNIAWMLCSLNEPIMASFVSRIDEIYALAEQSRGFVWRLPESTPGDLAPFDVDFPGFARERLLYNMSVWESLEDLRDYTFNSAHAELLNDRHQWIERVDGASVACWWIPVGHKPTIAESAERLRSVQKLGPTPFAFTMRKPFPPS
jgi:hypothetical protein